MIGIDNQKMLFGKGSLIGMNQLGSSKKIEALSKVRYITFSKLSGSKAQISELMFYNNLIGLNPISRLKKRNRPKVGRMSRALI